MISRHCSLPSHKVSTGGIQLSPKRIKLIQGFPRPTTKWWLHWFLDLAGYCWLWLPNFFLLVSPLYELTKISVPGPLPWEDRHEQAFLRLKQEPPALGLPTYADLSPCLCMSERTRPWEHQEDGNKPRPVVHYSVSLTRLLLPPQLSSGYSCSCKVSGSLSRSSPRKWCLFINSSCCPKSSYFWTDPTFLCKQSNCLWDPSALTT